MTQETFWKPEPKEPWKDWRTWGMFVPLLASMLGFAFTGLFAFSFSDIGVIRAEVQSWMVIIGSALIVWGAEANTPFTVIEVFRKILRKEANGWDISALIASLTGTAINVLVTFASRQVLFGDSVWRQWALSWGPLVSGIAVTLDYYGGMIELGFLFGSHEARADQWLTEREQWRVQNGLGVVQVGDELTKEIKRLNAKLAAMTERQMELEDRWTWPTATKRDFDTILAGMNGSTAILDAEILAMKLSHERLNPPSSSTVDRWLKMASTVKRGLGGS